MARRNLPWQRHEPIVIDSTTDDEVDDDVIALQSPPKRQRTQNNTTRDNTSNVRQPIVIDDDESAAEAEAVSSTPQETDPDFQSVGHIGISLPEANPGAKIVGVQYYRGIATTGENLLFVREPRNPYDRNAIRVDNVANIQVGQYFLSGLC
jgi:hypothetical protein